MLYCSVEVLHASPALSPCLLVASFVLPWHRPYIWVVSLPCVNISFDWGCRACYCLPLIIGFWCFNISPPYREAFNLCYSWERLLYRILSPLFYPAHNRDLGCLLVGVALPAISSSIPRRTTLSVLWFPTRAFYFSIAKVGQASCCKGRSPYLALKSFKDFGVQLLLDPNSLRHPDWNFCRPSLDIYIPSPCFRLYAL